MSWFRLHYVCAGVIGGLWLASGWWERGFAQSLGAPLFSPNGCYRVEAFSPFWVLPDLFHPEADPHEIKSPTWFPRWDNPGFYRLYDQRSGRYLGESKIYDLEHVGGPLHWGSATQPEVTSGLIVIGPNAPDCIGDSPAEPLGINRAYRDKTGRSSSLVIYSDVLWRKHEQIIALGDIS